MTTFERTAIFCKEDGLRRRLPYEFITFGGHGFISAAPFSLNPFAEVTTGQEIIELDDYHYDDNVQRPEFDKIAFEVEVESEAVFLSLNDGAFAFYDSNPSGELGYPRE